MFNFGLVSAAGICSETVIKEHQVSITQVRSKDTNKEGRQHYTRNIKW